MTYRVPFVNIITIIRPTVGLWAVVKGGRPPKNSAAPCTAAHTKYPKKHQPPYRIKFSKI